VRPVAIICSYNEADIIGWTLRHLARQGCDTMVIDCQSTDGTRKIIADEHAALIDAPAPPVSWFHMLKMVELLACTGSDRWRIHCDADEIRYTDIDGITLAEGFESLDRLGYNAVDHRVITFHPVDNGFDGSQDPEEYFRYYSGDPLNQRLGQVKAWRHHGPVSLAPSGGHQVMFSDRRVAPSKWLSLHYPIRSQAHGERKVFQERRWLDPLQGRKDWHVQYRGLYPGHNFLRRPETLKVLREDETLKGGQL